MTSSVAKLWNTRTGSSALRTVTALFRRIRFRARISGREDDSRSGVEELAAMMLANTKRIDADLVGTLHLLQEISHALDGTHRQTGGRIGDG